MTVSDTPAPAAADGPEPSPPDRGSKHSSPLLGAIVSSLLLAAWIAWQMGWVWAVAGVFGVLVHELGHLAVINAVGCGPGRIHFVPFLGGAASMRRNPDSEFKSVLIALAGPTLGLLATLPFFALRSVTGVDAWLGGAFFIAALNLLNLAPAPPLDGSKALGPVLAAIHPLVERAALVVVGALAVLWALKRGSFIFALFVGLGVLSALRSANLRSAAAPLTPGQWVAAAALYVVALAACLATLAATAPGASLADPAAALHRWGF